MKASSLSNQSPFIYFWLGILTGALLIIASMMIRQYAMTGSTSVLGTTSIVSPNVMPNYSTNGIVSPNVKQGIVSPNVKSIVSPNVRTR